MLIFLLFTLLAQAGGVSTLADCSFKGWDTRRRISDENLQLVKLQGGRICAARFMISPTDKQISDGHRAEIKDPLTLRAGATIRYRFDTYIPSTLRSVDFNRLVVAQWHDLKPDGQAVQRPPFSIRIKGDSFQFPLFNQAVWEKDPDGSGKLLAEAPVPYDRWVRFELLARWSAGDAGRLELLMDGKKIISYQGPVGYPADAWIPYLKIGAYTTQKFSGPIQVMHTNYLRVIVRNP